jgi:FdhD protein
MCAIEILDEHGERRAIGVPAERPLTVCIDRRELTTLMTLGACPELLVLGYLHYRGLIGDVSDLESISVDWPSGAAAVTTRAGLPDAVAAGAGDSAGLAPAATARIRRDSLYGLLDCMRELESLHRSFGSVHGCALFRGSELLAFVEDVGRHNAFDTLIGWMVLHGVVGADKTFYTTGRMTGDIVRKSARIGVPIIVSRNGASSLGCDLAKQLGMALFGRAVKRRFLCYAGAERFEAQH